MKCIIESETERTNFSLDLGEYKNIFRKSKLDLKTLDSGINGARINIGLREFIFEKKLSKKNLKSDCNA